MKVFLATLGCRLNEAELESWARDFRRRGYRITRTSDEPADVVVLNTCAVTGVAVRKSRQLIRRMQRLNPTAKLVVSGCYTSLPGSPPQDLSGVDLVVDNVDKDRLPEIAMRELALPVMPTLASEPGENALFERGRNRAFIKVQDGCRHRCTFCIVTRARGAERSRAIGTIVAEINREASAGIKEAVLTGVHLGGYGKDLDTDLYTLIKTVLADTDIARLRLGSLEPWDLHPSFLSLFENPKLMPHLHLPLQSGCDTVLRRMGRRCNTLEFSNLVNRSRAAVAGMSITSDIIVGFPGETAEEWRSSYAFIEALGFSHLHIFNYSPRDGTRAAELPDPVGIELKKERGRELHLLAKKMKAQFLRQQLGSTQSVLWESSNGAKSCSGYTPNYLRVRSTGSAPSELKNRITPGLLVELSDDREQLIAETGSLK